MGDAILPMYLAQAAAKAITAKRVPALTPYYVPREDVYEAMKRSLLENSEGSRLFVLCGMAGVGKTQSSSYYESINYKKYVLLYALLVSLHSTVC